MKIQKNEHTQLRVEETEYKGRLLVNIRDWYEADGEYLPTKKGVTVPPELLPELIEGLTALNKKLVNEVSKTKDKQEVYIIAKTKEDAQFHKKKMYKTLEDALEKSPPDGYFIYWAVVGGGSVLQIKAKLKRVNGAWRTSDQLRKEKK